MATKPNASDSTAVSFNTASSGAVSSNPAEASASSDVSSATPRQSGFAPAGSSKLAPPLPNRPFDFRECYELTAAARAAIPLTEVLNPGALDVPYAAKVAMGAATRIDKYRDKIAQRFADELAEIDMIDTYARGATHSFVLLSTNTVPPEKVQEVYDAALTARRFLYSDLNNLVTLGLIAPKTLTDVSNEAGHLNAATDIQKLVSIAEKLDDAVEARLAISAATRNEYLVLAYQLTELASRRDTGGVTSEEARNNLARAVTLLVNAYRTAERVMTYVLWMEGTLRDVVPSLYNNQPKGRKGHTTPETPASIPLAPIASPVDAVADDEPIAPGARGGSPFAGKS